MKKRHDVRTTLTIDEDVATLLEKENRRAGEPMKQTVSRLLRSGLSQAAKPPQPGRFVVKPLDSLGTQRSSGQAGAASRSRRSLTKRTGRLPGDCS